MMEEPSVPDAPLGATYSDSEKRYLRAEIAVMVSESETLWSDVRPSPARVERIEASKMRDQMGKNGLRDIVTERLDEAITHIDGA